MKKIFNLIAFMLLTSMLPSLTSCSNDDDDIIPGNYPGLAFIIMVTDSNGNNLLDTRNPGHVELDKLKINVKGHDLKVGEKIESPHDSIPSTHAILITTYGGIKKLVIGDYSYTKDYTDERATITWEDGHTDTLSFTKKAFESGYYYLNGKLVKGAITFVR